MIAILLSVLKFILLFVLGIVALALFLVVVVLISPLRYEVEGDNLTAKMRGKAYISWLFGIVQVKMMYKEGENPKTAVKIFWRTWGKQKRKKRRKQKAPSAKQPSAGVPAGDLVMAREKVVEPKPEPPVEKPEPPVEKIEPKPEPPVETVIPMQKQDATTSKPVVRRVKISTIEEKPVVEEQEFFADEEMEASGADVSETFAKGKAIWANIQAVEGKKQIWKAIQKLIGRLLKGILPKNITIKATVGLGEPELTGYFMAIMGMLVAKFGSNIDVKADFTRMVAEDIQVQMKGKIVMGYFVYAVLAFVLTDAVRKLLWKLWKGRVKNG